MGVAAAACWFALCCRRSLAVSSRLHVRQHFLQTATACFTRPRTGKFAMMAHTPVRRFKARRGVLRMASPRRPLTRMLQPLCGCNILNNRAFGAKIKEKSNAKMPKVRINRLFALCFIRQNSSLHHPHALENRRLADKMPLLPPNYPPKMPKFRFHFKKHQKHSQKLSMSADKIA